MIYKKFAHVYDELMKDAPYDKWVRFINKKGEAVLIERLEEKLHPYLIEMYLAYRPRASFQGLPPLDDVVCEKWVRDMIQKGTNLVALSFERGVVGHAALFPA